MSHFKWASLLTSLQDHCIEKISQTFHGNELFHPEAFSGCAAPEERLLPYWGCSSLKHPCDHWGAGLHCRSAALANASQPRGLTSGNICSKFLKHQTWKRTITMSTHSLRLTLSAVLSQQELLMFSHIQGGVIKLFAAMWGCFYKQF